MKHIKISSALAILGVSVIASTTTLALNTGSDIGAQSTVTSTISVFTPQTTTTTPPAPEPSGPAPEPSGPGAEPETTTEEGVTEGNGETEE